MYSQTGFDDNMDFNNQVNYYDYRPNLGAMSTTSSPYSQSSMDSPESSQMSTSPALSPQTLHNLLILSPDEQLARNIAALSTSRHGVPYLEVLEQPVEKFRFRYRSEMHGAHGSILGRSSQSHKHRSKTYPRVQLCNYTGPAEIRCSLFTADLDEGLRAPHTHRLVVRVGNDDVDDPHSEMVDVTTGYTATFQGMGIIHTAKKNIADELVIKKKKRLLEQQQSKNINMRQLSLSDETQIKADAEREAKRMNLNVVTLCFECVVKTSSGVYVPLCNPVFSQPINNMKSALTGELKICRIDRVVSCCLGNDEVYLLVEKVGKKNIVVRFFELDEDDNEVWSANGKFTELDVHHQFAIVLRTPPYRNPHITETVDVYVELYRPSDGDHSDAIRFKYKPSDKTLCLGRKRARRSSEVFEYLPQPVPPASSLLADPMLSLPNGSDEAMESFPSASSLLRDFEAFNSEEFNEYLRNVDTTGQQEFNVPLFEDANLVPDGFNPAPNVVHGGVHAPYNLEGALVYTPEMNSEGALVYTPEMNVLEEQMGPRQLVYQMSAGQSNRPVHRVGQAGQPHRPTQRVGQMSAPQARSAPRQVVAPMSSPRVPSQTYRPTTGPRLPTQKDTPTAMARAAGEVYPEGTSDNDKLLMKVCRRLKELATMKRSLNTVRDLFNEKTEEGESALHLAVLHEDKSHLRVILQALCGGSLADVLDSLNHNDDTALHLSALSDQPSAVSALLAGGADCSLVNGDGDTALHLAVKHSHHRCLMPLLRHECRRINIDTRNEKGWPALHLAVLNNNLRALRELCTAGCDVNSLDKSGSRSALHMAVEENRIDMLEHLLENTAIAVNHQDRAGNTALHVAVVKRCRQAVQRLVKAGADPLIANYSLAPSDGEADDVKTEALTPLDMAAGNQEILNLILAGVCSEPYEEHIEVKLEPEDVVPSLECGLYLDKETLSSLCRILDANSGWRELATLLDLDFLVASIGTATSPTKMLINYADVHGSLTVERIRDSLTALNQSEAVEAVDLMLARNFADQT